MNQGVSLSLAVLSDVVSLFLVIMNGLRVLNFYGCFCTLKKREQKEISERVNKPNEIKIVWSIMII